MKNPFARIFPQQKSVKSSASRHPEQSVPHGVSVSADQAALMDEIGVPTLHDMERANVEERTFQLHVITLNKRS